MHTLQSILVLGASCTTQTCGRGVTTDPGVCYSVQLVQLSGDVSLCFLQSQQVLSLPVWDYFAFDQAVWHMVLNTMLKLFGANKILCSQYTATDSLSHTVGTWAPLFLSIHSLSASDSAPQWLFRPRTPLTLHQAFMFLIHLQRTLTQKAAKHLLFKEVPSPTWKLCGPMFLTFQHSPSS